MRLNQLSKPFCHFDLQNMHSELINLVSKNVDLLFYFLRMLIKRSHSVPSQDHTEDILSAQKCSCLSQCVRARIVVVKGDPSSAVGFPDFLKDNWLSKWLCATQSRLFCAVLVVRLRHILFFLKNKRSFARKCFVREQLLFCVAHLETPIQ